MERKKAEDGLRESEELYRTLVNLSPDAISVADMNGLLTFASPKGMQLFGDSADDEILGRSILSWIAPDEQEKASANMRRLLTEGIVTATEYTLLKKDGTRFIGEVNASIIYSPDGSPMSMIIITRDVTERKRAEEALRESEQRLSQIIDFLPDATFAIDLNGKVIAWNRAIEEMTGVKAEQILGKGD
ncbi:MAG TPA: PAS domain S-box protein, partial [Deltaproteobacteria bacterium]|nr:PAS domain S-box protein [Deltaproteobacteria bacterium]